MKPALSAGDGTGLWAVERPPESAVADRGEAVAAGPLAPFPQRERHGGDYGLRRTRAVRARRRGTGPRAERAGNLRGRRAPAGPPPAGPPPAGPRPPAGPVPAPPPAFLAKRGCLGSLGGTKRLLPLPSTSAQPSLVFMAWCALQSRSSRSSRVKWVLAQGSRWSVSQKLVRTPQPSAAQVGNTQSRAVRWWGLGRRPRWATPTTYAAGAASPPWPSPPPPWRRARRPSSPARPGGRGPLRGRPAPGGPARSSGRSR